MDPERAGELLEKSLALATALVPALGYDAAAEIAREAARTGQSLREVCRARGVLSDAELERLLDPRAMTQPGDGPP